MRELRIAMVMVSPLLADLVQRVVAARLKLSGMTIEILDRVDAAPDTAPDLVIIDQKTAPLALPTLLRGTKILILSADRHQIFGPGPNEVAPLTTQNLTALLLKIAQ